MQCVHYMKCTCALHSAMQSVFHVPMSSTSQMFGWLVVFLHSICMVMPVCKLYMIAAIC